MALRECTSLFRSLLFNLDQFRLRHARTRAQTHRELAQFQNAALPGDETLRRIGGRLRHRLDLASADEGHAFGKLEGERLTEDWIMDQRSDIELFARFERSAEAHLHIAFAFKRNGDPLAVRIAELALAAWLDFLRVEKDRHRRIAHRLDDW